MKNILYYLFLFLFISTLSFSQNLSLSVVSAQGDFDKTENISLEWTLGESFIETVNYGSTTFTQGFNQSFNNRILNINESIFDFNIQVYPNPVYKQFHVYFDAIDNEILLLKLYDIHGRILIEEISILNNNNNTLIDITNLSSGLYLLNISDLEGLIIESHKIIKY